MRNLIETWMMAGFLIDAIVYCDFPTASGHKTRSRFESSIRVSNRIEPSPFLATNLDSLSNRSKILEEEIFSDAILDWKGGINNVSGNEDDDFSKFLGSEGGGKMKKIERLEDRNGGFFRGESNRSSINRNSISSPSIDDDDNYFLGFAGNPFSIGRGIFHWNKFQFSNKDSVSDARNKRSVLDLYGMLFCATGCNPIRYKGYGCYCGFLGSGYVVDGIDSCCKMHDRCYNTAGCPPFLEYFIPYLWKCYYRQPLCAIDYGYYGWTTTCSQRLCECDRQLAICLKRYPCPTTKALCTSSPWRLLQNILLL